MREKKEKLVYIFAGGKRLVKGLSDKTGVFTINEVAAKKGLLDKHFEQLNTHDIVVFLPENEETLRTLVWQFEAIKTEMSGEWNIEVYVVDFIRGELFL